MHKHRAIVGLAAVAGGLAFFVAAVGLTIGLAMYNAKSMPAVPWFPVPVLGVLFATVFWLNRRFGIGLELPKGRRWGAIVLFAVTSMIASHCVLILEGAFHGITRSFEAAPPGVTPLFALVYWVAVVIAMSTASETAFRGLMQSRLIPLFGVWPAILIPMLVNTVSHRWDGLYERLFGVAAILLAWGYLRHISGSLTPTLLTHIAAIFIWDAILWTYGPWDHAAMGPGALTATAAIGLVSFAGALWSARRAGQAPLVALATPAHQ